MCFRSVSQREKWQVLRDREEEEDIHVVPFVDESVVVDIAGVFGLCRRRREKQSR